MYAGRYKSLTDFAPGALMVNVTLSEVMTCHCSSTLVVGEASIVGSDCVGWAFGFSEVEWGVFLHAKNATAVAPTNTSKASRRPTPRFLNLSLRTIAVNVLTVGNEAGPYPANETSDRESRRDKSDKSIPVVAECLARSSSHTCGS